MKDQHEIIKKALGKGVPHRTIYRKLNIPERTFYDRLKKSKELQAAQEKYLAMVQNIFET